MLDANESFVQDIFSFILIDDKIVILSFN